MDNSGHSRTKEHGAAGGVESGHPFRNVVCWTAAVDLDAIKEIAGRRVGVLRVVRGLAMLVAPAVVAI